MGEASAKKADDVLDAASDGRKAPGCGTDSCFAAGTPILTPNGSRPIETIRKGDLILSRHEASPESISSVARVGRLFTSRAALLTLVIGSRSISTTAEHPFWVRRRGWTDANKIIIGDQLVGLDNRWVAVSEIRFHQELVPVYNFEVEELHTYFIGGDDWEFSVWAHNDACPGGDGGAMDVPKAVPQTLKEVDLPARIRATGSNLAEAGEFFGWKPSKVIKGISDFTNDQLLAKGWTKEKLLDVAEGYENIARITPANPSAAGRAAQLRELATLFD